MANYIRENWSADLDFGTGEWSVSAWVNVPATLPKSSFPRTGIELITNGNFDAGDTGWVLTGNAVISGGKLVCNGAFTATQNPTAGDIKPNTTYLVEFDVELTSGWFVFQLGTSSNNAYTITSGGKYSAFYTVAGSAGTDRFSLNAGTSFIGTIDNISVFEVKSAIIAERSYTSGPRMSLGLTGSGALVATSYDGATDRIVTSAPSITIASFYNIGAWIKVRASYSLDGSLALLVNGVEVAATRGAPLLTLNNPNAVLTIGNSYALDAPFPGSIALLKFSATAPTPEQSVWMYEQEKQLFREGARCCLPDAGAIVDLTYDDATDKWIAVSATNESEWSGLVRTSVKAVPAGSFSKVAVTSGVKLEARTTTTPGVDITIPAYGLREELVKRAESAARLARNLTTFDYVGGFTANTTNGSTSITNVAGLSYPTSHIGAQVTGTGIPAGTVITAVSGTTAYLSKAATATGTTVQISFTDFILPVGYEAKAVMSAGALKQEGATKDYTRLFDGFKETLRFGAAPGYTTWVQIQATRSIV